MRLIHLLCLCLFATPTYAQNNVLAPGFESCLEANVSKGTPVIECVTKAHASCELLESEHDEAMSCYKKAKLEWGKRMQALLSGFSDKPAELQEVARIEAKYSVTFNLMNCDMRQEISQIGRVADASDALSHVKCEAVAAAASLTEVLFKSGTITRN